MLTLRGPSYRFCDGLSRRAFLNIGGLSLGALGSLSLADVLRAERSPGTGRPHKAVINILLGGGPPHMDMWDIKTEAPVEIRGEFAPISTAVPGIQIGELFPRIAAAMDQFAIIRSVVGSDGKHDNFQCLSGWPGDSLAAVGGRPAIGPVLARLRGPVDAGVPPTVGLAPKTKYMPWSNSGGPGFLGATYAPFKPDGRGLANLQPSGIALDRLRDRKQLRQQFDQARRGYDAGVQATGVDAFQQAAFEVLTSNKLIDALDLSQEDPRVRARYGDGQPWEYVHDGAPTVNEHLLLARRLVEAGVRCVTLTYGRWDTHGTNHGAPANNFDVMRTNGPKLDMALTALIQDLAERRLLEDVLVLAWGEFGRTPRVNKKGGRDHWAPVSCALLAGGGLQTGQVIGSTNRFAEYAQDRPVHMQEIVATAYHHLGVDPQTTTLTDPNGRPQYLLDHRVPIKELI